jgi:hypothetical protein
MLMTIVLDLTSFWIGAGIGASSMVVLIMTVIFFG